MIQTQTFSISTERRARAMALAREIERAKHDPERMAKLIFAHDELMAGAPTKLYDQREELQEVAQCL